MKFSALIAGASGLVGGYCLRQLLEDPDYQRVVSIVRTTTGSADPKLEETVVDFDRLDRYNDLFSVDHVYCCLGTTIKKAGSRKAFRTVDEKYPLQMAEYSRRSGVKVFSIVTAMGADPGSVFFYNRVKGRVEAALEQSDLPSVNILQPSLLMGRRQEERRGERMAQLFMTLTGPVLVGPLKPYRGIAARQVAHAMIRITKMARPGVKRWPSGRLQDL